MVDVAIDLAGRPPRMVTALAALLAQTRPAGDSALHAADSPWLGQDSPQALSLFYKHQWVSSAWFFWGEEDLSLSGVDARLPCRR